MNNQYIDNLTNQTVTVRENKDNDNKPVYLVKYPAPSTEVSTTEVDFKKDKFTSRFTKVD